MRMQSARSTCAGARRTYSESRTVSQRVFLGGVSGGFRSFSGLPPIFHDFRMSEGLGNVNDLNTNGYRVHSNLFSSLLNFCL